MRKPLGKSADSKQNSRLRRRLSIRKKINGTTEKPRLCVIKTNKHLSVQVIDDTVSKTLFSVQSFGKKVDKSLGNNKAGAKVIGAAVAEKLKSAKIEAAVFDRAGHKYHGVIAALVDSIRENGIRV